MRDVYEYVHARLEEWADWYTRCQDFGIGHRSKNIIASLMELGGYIIRGTGPIELPTNLRAEEIEKLVCEMSQHNRRIADALRQQYLKQGTSRYKARCLGISYSQFRMDLDMARNWLVGRLSNQSGIL